VLTTAERLIEARLSDSLLSAKLRFRRRVLSRLDGQQIEHDHTERGPSDGSWNAYKGEVILFNVQCSMDHDDLPYAWQLLKSFTLPGHRVLPHAWRLSKDFISFPDPCLFPEEIPYLWPVLENVTLSAKACSSPEEYRILQRYILFALRICRFAGDFRSAKVFLLQLDELYKKKKMFKKLRPDYVSEHTMVLCELDEIRPEGLLGIETLLDPNWQGLESKGRRVSLTTAAIYLMNGLMSVKSQKLDEALPYLHKAKLIYANLVDYYLSIPSPRIGAKIRHLAASAGVSMIAHLQCRLTGSVRWEDALSYWQTTLAIVRKDYQEAGFIQMIVSYAMGDIKFCLGMSAEADKLFSEARSLYRKTGRQFYIVGLGSVFFDLIGDWASRDGRSRLDELRYPDYLNVQRRNGFPFEEGSSRDFVCSAF
jgi:tetratricopeptide (TPR) repeat protein